MTISAKKDGVVNMERLPGHARRRLYRKAMQYSIMYEGVTSPPTAACRPRHGRPWPWASTKYRKFEQLDARIRQVKLLGDLLDEIRACPTSARGAATRSSSMRRRSCPTCPKEEFIAQTLGIELYLEAGIRGVEIGSILADRDPETHENRYPKLELLRLAIPRRVYTDNHIRVIAAACRNIYERREQITSGYKITFETPSCATSPWSWSPHADPPPQRKKARNVPGFLVFRSETVLRFSICGPLRSASSRCPRPPSAHGHPRA